MTPISTQQQAITMALRLEVPKLQSSFGQNEVPAMFGDLKGKNARSRGGEGPMAVPHDAKVQLRRLQEDPDVIATRSLLSLSAVAASSNEAQEESDDIHANATEETRQETSELELTFGLALEYAAGVAFRQRVLEPILADFFNAPPAETMRLLGKNCRGESLFVITSGGVKQASMKRIEGKDATILEKWWSDDKFLSFTDQAWSDWWIQRCQILDPGCEMYKLATENGETLGVVYLERNILDHVKFGNKGRITLIRGIRVAPHLNPQVQRRKDLSSGGDAESKEEIYKRILLLLFHHVLYMSVRYGSNAVGVNSPKTREMEDFYDSVMGTPLVFDKSGRKYYRVEYEDRWRALRKAFVSQVEFQRNRAATGKRKKSS